VKSAYRFMTALESQDSLENSTRNDDKKLWKFLWKMHILQKIKIFEWKACKDGLPTKHNLYKRRFVEFAKCDFCGSHNKDLTHALISCPDILTTWNMFMPAISTINPIDSIRGVARQLLNTSDLSQLERFFLIAWAF